MGAEQNLVCVLADIIQQFDLLVFMLIDSISYVPLPTAKGSLFGWKIVLNNICISLREGSWLGKAVCKMKETTIQSVIT